MKLTPRHGARAAPYAIALSLAATALSLASWGCASAPPPESVSWKRLERSGESVTLSLARDTKITFTGTADEPTADGETVMRVEDIYWFDNWHDGWTEATVACTGKISATRDGNSWRVRVIEPVVFARVTEAGIRYRDALVLDSEARSLLERRLLRIRSACDFLRTALGAKEFALYDSGEKEHRALTFRHAAGTLLFPEVYGYAPGLETAGSRYVSGEGLRWDATYSERSLPAELREVRDTGTLWRDWEETGRMFYYIYMMESVTNGK